MLRLLRGNYSKTCQEKYFFQRSAPEPLGCDSLSMLQAGYESQFQEVEKEKQCLPGGCLDAFIGRLSEKSCYSFRVLVHNITSQSQVRDRDSRENTYFGSEHNFQKHLNAKYTFSFFFWSQNEYSIQTGL